MRGHDYEHPINAKRLPSHLSLEAARQLRLELTRLAQILKDSSPLNLPD